MVYADDGGRSILSEALGGDVSSVNVQMNIFESRTSKRYLSFAGSRDRRRLAEEDALKISLQVTLGGAVSLPSLVLWYVAETPRVSKGKTRSTQRQMSPLQVQQKKSNVLQYSVEVSSRTEMDGS